MLNRDPNTIDRMSNEQYFTAEPASASQPYTIKVALPDGTMQLTTDRGVFSHGALDTGTRVLLLKAPAPSATGNLLDIGCGTGAIALTLGRRSPAATVWAIDTNQRALALTRENARTNKVDNVSACTPEQIDADLRFDTIWSNPPIHIGKPAMHAMLLQWLPRLTPRGQAVMVVQKHLGSDSLVTWLNTEGLPTERIGSAKGYRLLRTTLP
ncbi:MAG: transporter [Ilumatobacteraceae bacterium]|nr:transporter [Ilumatobacteraceae bacterium]